MLSELTNFVMLARFHLFFVNCGLIWFDVDQLCVDCFNVGLVLSYVGWFCKFVFDCGWCWFDFIHCCLILVWCSLVSVDCGLILVDGGWVWFDFIWFWWILYDVGNVVWFWFDFMWFCLILVRFYENNLNLVPVYLILFDFG